MTGTLRISRAQGTNADLETVVGLMSEASTWLAVKDTDQWAKPWPSRKQRDVRVRRGEILGDTWIVSDGSRVAATVTVTGKADPTVWSPAERDRGERAVYAHRLIVARNYSSLGLGTELIDWIGLRGHRDYGAMWIRIDVWSTNTGLHDYYAKRGFEPCGYCDNPSYPSGALFQKPVSKIAEPAAPLFSEAEEPTSGVPTAGHDLLFSPADSMPFAPCVLRDYSRNWPRSGVTAIPGQLRQASTTRRRAGGIIEGTSPRSRAASPRSWERRRR